MNHELTIGIHRGDLELGLECRDPEGPCRGEYNGEPVCYAVEWFENYGLECIDSDDKHLATIPVTLTGDEDGLHVQEWS